MVCAFSGAMKEMIGPWPSSILRVDKVATATALNLDPITSNKSWHKQAL